jgi:N-acetylglucosamine-6-phosphate deacetylase
MPDHIEDSIVIRNAAVVLPDGLRRCDIGMRSGKIECIGEALDGYKTEIDAHEHMVIPGMLDIHTHGAMRIDVNHATTEDLDTLSRFFASEGATGFMPTLICDSESRMIAQIRRIAEARGHMSGAKILGCHLEGPFLSHEYKRAMPSRYLRDGDAALISRFLLAAKSCKLCMTVAPEVKNIGALMHYMASQGICVRLGHSGATYEQSMHCIRLGANCVVHVMNAMRPIDRHEPGLLGAALESDVFCEFICDGLHLHPANIRLLLKAKGVEKVVAVTDSMMATGLGDGIFSLGINKIIVKDGDAKLRNGKTRAGSTLTMRKALVNLLHFTDLPLDKAILPLSSNPARMLGLDKRKGRIAEGMDADLVVLDAHMNVLYTFVEQRLVYRRAPEAGQSI